MNARSSIEQRELIDIISARPRNFAWFLGAGTSRSAGLPSATDLLWDMKRHFYCREENQEITRQDVQNDAVRLRIQTFMESRGFPAELADREYETYFQKLFDDKEKQRRYLAGLLSEEKIKLSSGHRVFGAMITLGAIRVIFTTNFDNVVEKAAAVIGGKVVSPYHLEGTRNAKQALDNEEYPFYCKLHGDFRFDSLKNLPTDLATQDTHLAQCLVNAGTRFGFVVAGYSGRDLSILNLFKKVLATPNPFPHGFYWTHLKGTPPCAAVVDLLDVSRAHGVKAYAVPIETFDSMMTRLWRNLDDKTPEFDAKVRRTSAATVSIPLPGPGTRAPLIRLNALPIVKAPTKCLELNFKTPMDWSEIWRVQEESGLDAIFTKAEKVWAWGDENDLRAAFGADLLSISVKDIPTDLDAPGNLHVKGFVEQALCHALAKDRPLLQRKVRNSGLLIVDPKTTDIGQLDPLFKVIGKTFGIIDGAFSPVTPEHPDRRQLSWAESCHISLDAKDGLLWAQLDPNVWIWPNWARNSAVQFLDRRRGNRYNKLYNSLLDAWIQVIFDSNEKNIEIEVSAFSSPSDASNPTFRLSNRTAYSRRISA